MKKTTKKTQKNMKKSKEVVAPSSAPIQPLQDRILVKEASSVEETMTKSGIIIPAGAEEDKGSKKGTVVAVGSGRYEHGVRIPVSVKAGDTVLFQWGDKIRVNDEEFYIVRESEILAIIK